MLALHAHREIALLGHQLLNLRIHGVIVRAANVDVLGAGILVFAGTSQGSRSSGSRVGRRPTRRPRVRSRRRARRARHRDSDGGSHPRLRWRRPTTCEPELAVTPPWRSHRGSAAAPRRRRSAPVPESGRPLRRPRRRRNCDRRARTGRPCRPVPGRPRRPRRVRSGDRLPSLELGRSTASHETPRRSISAPTSRQHHAPPHAPCTKRYVGEPIALSSPTRGVTFNP